MRCFVMHAIGRPDTDDRRHVDKIWARVIHPALRLAEQETGESIHAVPIQHDMRPKDILSDLIDRILTNEILISIVDGYDLSGTNPNVMYELGIAHSAGREVIIIRDADRRVTTPNIFDLNQRSQIRYRGADLDSDAISSCVDQVCKAIVSQVHEAKIGASVGRRIAFHDRALDAFGSRHSEYHLISKFNGPDHVENLPFAEWSRFFNAATEYIIVSGVTLLQLSNPNESFELSNGRKASFADLLSAKAIFEGVKVSLVMFGETHKGLGDMLRGVISGGDVDRLGDVQDEIRQSNRRWSRTASRVQAALADLRRKGENPTGSFEVVTLSQGYLNGRVSLTDQGLILTPYFVQQELNGVGPALYAKSGTTMHTFLKAHFDFLIENNRPRDDEAQEGRAASG